MLKTETREIDGCKVTCVMIDPMRAMAIEPEIMDAAAAMVGALRTINIADLIGKKKEEITIEDVLRAAPLLRHLASAFGGGKLVQIVPTLLSGTTIIYPVHLPDGTVKNAQKNPIASTSDINEVFAGRPLTRWKVIAFAIELNFGEYFSALAAAVRVGTEKARQAALKDSTKSKSDSGSAGDSSSAST